MSKIEKKDMSELVSVVVPCFNCAVHLEKTIDSILSQTYKNLECIIVDDGSTDNSKEICDMLIKRDNRVRYLYKDNNGVAAARNFGIRHAKGKWVQQLDSDDFLHKDKINRHLTQLKDVDSSRDIIFYTDWDIIWLKDDQEIRQGDTIIVGNQTNQALLNQLLKWQFLPNSPLSNNTLFFKKEVFRHKMYDETLGAFEDFELFVDLLLRDILFIYTPIVGMSYLQHSTNMTRDKGSIVSNYVLYLRAINQKDSFLIEQCQTIGPLLQEMLLNNDKKRYWELTALIDDTAVPAYFFKKKFNFRNTRVLRLLFIARTALPILTVRNTCLYTVKFIQRLRYFIKHRILKIPVTPK